MSEKDIFKLYDDYMEVVRKLQDKVINLDKENLHWTYPTMSDDDFSEYYLSHVNCDEIRNCLDILDLMNMCCFLEEKNNEMMMKKLSKNL